MILRKYANGLVAVNQEPVNGWLMSFNPDDDRFYVVAPAASGPHGIVAKTFGGTIASGFKNAREFARRNQPFSRID